MIAVHSHKGGTGKTLISANLATLFAAKGKKTCLLDMDFRAPSLHSMFKTANPTFWLNDYLNGECEPDKIIQSCTRKRFEKKRLFVGFANPSTKAIMEMARKDTEWKMLALQRLLCLRETLISDQGFEYLILDTSPGFHYSSINSLVTADIALIVTTTEKSDITGTKQMFNHLYKQIGNKTMVLLNKVPSDMLQSQEIERLKDSFEPEELIICGEIACFCELPLSEDPFFFACEKEDHPFSKGLRKIVSRLMLLNIRSES